MIRSTTVPPSLVDLRPGAPARSSALRRIRALIELTKPRLAFFSILSAMAAYGAAGATSVGDALLSLLGISLSAGGALSLNQWWERDLDRLMRRTCGRPLPSAMLAPTIALAWSVALSALGVGVLAAFVNIVAAAIALSTILLYGLIYTPLKRRTRWATEVGAIAGALPPLLGAAAAGRLDASTAWILFGVLLFWQMPHFFAIGWMHRDDYRAAAFPLLPAIDRSGTRTAGWSLIYAGLAVAVSLAAWVLGFAGAIFGVVALATGAAFFACAVQFLRAASDRDAAARRLFLASIAYLPLVMAALLLDRLL